MSPSQELAAVAGGAAAGFALGIDAASERDSCGGAPGWLAIVSLAPADRATCVSFRACCSPLRNCRHVSELRSRLAAFAVTAGFAPRALLVSRSSWPVIGNPLRI